MPTATNSARRRSVASAPRTAADQALQERRERDGGDLEDAAHRREDVPPARRTRVARRRGERRDLRERSACCEPTRRDGRLPPQSFSGHLAGGDDAPPWRWTWG